MMLRIIVSLLCLQVFGFTVTIAQPVIPKPLFQLQGTWAAYSKDKSVHEKWRREKEGYLTGVSMLITDNKDTTILLLLSIKPEGDGVYLTPVPATKNNEVPFKYKLISRAGSKFTFENNEAVFPKLIVYELGKNRTISVTQKGIINDSTKTVRVEYKRLDK